VWVGTTRNIILSASTCVPPPHPATHVSVSACALPHHRPDPLSGHERLTGQTQGVRAGWVSSQTSLSRHSTLIGTQTSKKTARIAFPTHVIPPQGPCTLGQNSREKGTSTAPAPAQALARQPALARCARRLCSRRTVDLALRRPTVPRSVEGDAAVGATRASPHHLHLQCKQPSGLHRCDADTLQGLCGRLARHCRRRRRRRRRRRLPRKCPTPRMRVVSRRARE
jgi:hypothetical protein